HPLNGIDPTSPDQEGDAEAWPVDVDDDLTRDTGTPIPEQFMAIARQAGRFTEEQLRDYLALAREEQEGAEAE
ncbi:MAG TPA: hypothetical protein VK399_13595, partial [Longimicrobiaceae bacterium]|nr:hypothetical protein [Longimicrobiaceae bacterium]